MPVELFLNTINPDTTQDGLTREQLKNLPEFWLYAFSCSFFMMSGLIRLKQGAFIDGSNLIFCSFFSFMSDVHTLGITSKWHVLDRYFALAISIYHFYSLKTRTSLLLNIVLFIYGFIHLKKSQKLYLEHSPEFLTEHTKWHLAAPLMALTSDL